MSVMRLLGFQESHGRPILAIPTQVYLVRPKKSNFANFFQSFLWVSYITQMADMYDSFSIAWANVPPHPNLKGC